MDETRGFQDLPEPMGAQPSPENGTSVDELGFLPSAGHPRSTELDTEIGDWLEPEATSRCVILAAGQGSRLREVAHSKPLHPLLGVPILERVIRTAMEAGLDEFYVVVGHQATRLISFLEELSARLGARIIPIRNTRWDQHENGYSLLLARDHLDGPFVLLMGDHLIEPALVQRLLQCPVAEGEVLLAVDRQLDNPLVDLEDVTRVWVEADRVQAIGKGLATFNGYDTGVFLCTGAIFEGMEAALDQGNSSLSGAIQYLADQGRVRAVDVSGLFWVDLDSPRALAQAEEALVGQLRTKPTDGPIARYLNRPLSSRLSRLLARYPVTPNQITLFAFALAGIAAGLFATGVGWARVLGGVLAQLASVIDGCDGEIARLKYLGSEYGGWLDAVLDRYADALLLFGLTWHLYARGAGDWVWVAGVGAMVGSFMVSYTAVKYDDRIREQVRQGRSPGLRIGRDLRLFLVALAAVLDLVAPVLVFLAVVMNGEAVRRLWVGRRTMVP